MKSTLKTLTILLAAIVFLSGINSSYAADTSANENIYRIKAEELKALVDKGETVLIVDVRSANAFMKMHITGALSVPLQQVEAKLAALSTETKIAFY